MLSIKVLDVPEIDKRIGSMILAKNPLMWYVQNIHRRICLYQVAENVCYSHRKWNLTVSYI